MGGNIVWVVAFIPLERREDKVFSQAKVPTTQGVKLCSSGVVGPWGFEESAFSVGPHSVVVVVVHATIG